MTDLSTHNSTRPLNIFEKTLFRALQSADTVRNEEGAANWTSASLGAVDQLQKRSLFAKGSEHLQGAFLEKLAEREPEFFELRLEIEGEGFELLRASQIKEADLNRVLSSDGDELTQVAQALILDPWVLLCKKSTAEPIRIKWKHNEAQRFGLGVLLIQIAPDVQVTFIEESEFCGNMIASTNVYVERSSAVRIFKSPAVTQTDRHEAVGYGQWTFDVHADAQVEVFDADTTSELRRTNIVVNLLQAGAKVDLRAALFCTNEQRQTHISSIRHKSPQTVSTQLHRAVLTGSSRLRFRGRVEIERGAEEASARQLHQSLLLSETARVFTKPELRISNDNVKASHGAAVGQIDPEQLFYFESRGIPKKQAYELLVSGFLKQDLNGWPESVVLQFDRFLKEQLNKEGSAR